MLPLLRDGALLSITEFLTLLLYFVQFIALGRVHGPEGVGHYNFIFAICTLLANLIIFPLKDYVIREVSREPAQRGLFFSNSLLFSLLAATIVAVLFAPFYWLGSDTFRSYFLPAFLAICCLGPLARSGVNILFAERKFKQVAAINLVVDLTIVGINLLLLCYRLPLVYFFYAFTTGQLIGLVLTSFFLRPIALRFSPGDFLALLRNVSSLISFFLTSFSANLLHKLSTIISRQFLSDRVFGLFAATLSLNQNVATLYYSFANPFYPWLSVAFGRKDSATWSKVTAAYRTTLIALALVVVLIALLAEPLVPRIFGEDFADMPVVLLLCTPALLFSCLVYLSTMVLNAVDEEKTNATIKCVSLPLAVAINALLTCCWGILGAIAALSLVLLFILTWQAGRIRQLARRRLPGAAGGAP